MIPDGYVLHKLDASATAISAVFRASDGQIWRRTVTPADDLSVFPEDARSQIQALMTPERVAAYEAAVIPVVPDAPIDLKAYAADKRWRVETGGISRLGVVVPTDDRAKLLLLGAATGMADGDTAPFNVGTSSVTLTGLQFKSLYAAVFAHVQNCMARQSEIMAEIDAGTITTTDQIEGAAWPV